MGGVKAVFGVLQDEGILGADVKMGTGNQKDVRIRFGAGYPVASGDKRKPSGQTAAFEILTDIAGGSGGCHAAGYVLLCKEGKKLGDPFLDRESVGFGEGV